MRGFFASLRMTDLDTGLDGRPALSIEALAATLLTPTDRCRTQRHAVYLSLLVARPIRDWHKAFGALVRGELRHRARHVRHVRVDPRVTGDHDFAPLGIGNANHRDFVKL